MSKELDAILSKYKSRSAVGFLKEYSLINEINFLPPVSESLIDSFEQSVTKFPKELREVYKFTNGFFSPRLTLLPIFDKKNVKKTWDSINKANSQKTSFNFSAKWFEHLCIFARFSGDFALAFDKNDSTFWVEYPDKVNQVLYNLRDMLLIGLES